MKNSDISLKKLPPHNPVAEKCVLGAVLFDNDSLMKVSGIIEEGDFYEPAHRKIFKIMWEMSGKGERIDLVTLAEALLVSGDLEIVGGPAYLMDLMEITPTATAIVAHAKIVKEKADLRKLIAISTQLNLDAYGEGVSVEKLLENADKKLYDIRGDSGEHGPDWEKLGDTLPGLREDIESITEPAEDAKERSIHDIPTGFKCLDELIVGLPEQSMTIVAARPSMGKTAFAFSVARNIAMTGLPTAIFSIETPRKKAATRFLCTEAKVDSHKIKEGHLDGEDWGKLLSGIAALDNIPLHICDCPSLTLQDLRYKAKRIVKEQGVEVIIIDYLQLMKTKGTRGNREEAVSELSKGIKAIGRELNVRMIALSQLSRKVEERKPPRPMLSDLRESGAIEQDADIVIFLYRHAYYQKQVLDNGGQDLTTEIIVSKNRDGRVGTAKAIFIPKYTRFEDISY